MNGIDTSTNNHDTGKRVMMSGLTTQNVPAIGALVAATYGQNLPMGFFSAGGYDNTGNLVPLSRAGNTGAMQKIALPNVINPNRDEPEFFHTNETWQRIREAQARRLTTLQGQQTLPRLVQSTEDLELARLQERELARLDLPETLVDIPGYQLNDLQGFMRQAQLAAAALRSHVSIAANIDLGGFDTHDNHDERQRRQLYKLLGGLAFLADEVERQGIADRTTIVVVSDFGRTPNYNDGNGKDRWPITSTMAWGAGIAGNRVIGATDDAQQARQVDPQSLAVVDDGGVTITPAHVHQALRAKAGVASEIEERFPLPGESLALFG